jgi:hypothetical protein
MMLAGGDFMVDLDHQRTDTAGRPLRAVPEIPSSPTFIARTKRFDEEVFAGIEAANTALVSRWYKALDAERREALAALRPTLDLDPTDVEVYGPTKAGVAYNHTGQRVGRPHPVISAEEPVQFLCMGARGWLVRCAGEAVGVGDGEGAEGLSPALDGGSHQRFSDICRRVRFWLSLSYAERTGRYSSHGWRPSTINRPSSGDSFADTPLVSQLSHRWMRLGSPALRGGVGADAGRDQAEGIVVRRMLHHLTGGLVLFVVVLIVYALSPVDLGGYDPKLVSLAAHSLVHDRDLDLDEFSADSLLRHPLMVGDGSGAGTVAVYVEPHEVDRARRPGVHMYDFFPWATAVAATPAVVAADAKAAVFGGLDSRVLVEQGGLNRYLRLLASLIVAGAAVAVRALAFGRFGGARIRRRAVASLVGVAFALGTTAWSTASRGMWQHTPALLVMAVGFWLALGRTDAEGSGPARRWSWVAAGGFLAAGCVVRPTNLVVVAALGIWVAVAHRRSLVPFVAGGLAVVGMAAVVSRFAVGTALPEYYRDRFLLHDRVVEAVAAQWVSPSRGLLWASPFLVLAVPGVVVAWRRDRQGERALVAALVVAVVGVTVSVSAFDHWWAGHSYGPRFMTEALIPLIVLGLPAVEALVTVPRVWRLVAAGAAGMILVWSFAVHFAGATRTYGQCWNAHPTDVDAHPERIWNVGHNQLAFAMKNRIEPGAPPCPLPK